MEPKKVSNSLALRRMAALEKGQFKVEDLIMISFLVGSEDSLAEEICACKFDLVVASEYFQGLLRSPLTPDGPIRLKHIDPVIFRFVVEFTHLSGQLVSKVNNLQQWLKLSAAADEFLLDELGQLCTEKLEELINVNNVWTVFSHNHLIKYASAVCEKLLSSKTDECLKQPAFLKIAENALAKFLGLKKMNIKSEMQLVMACLKFIKGKEDERALFRQYALPHLRLLTVSADDLLQVAPFLDKNEKLFLSLNLLEKDPLQMKNELSVDTSLCKEVKQREPIKLSAQIHRNCRRFLVLVPSQVLGFGSKIRRIDYQYLKENDHYCMSFEARESIKITGFEILGQITAGGLFEDTFLLASYYNNEFAVGWIDSTEVTLSVSNDGRTWYNSMNLTPWKRCKLWAYFETSIFVAKGGKVQIFVKLKQPCYVRNVVAQNSGNSEIACTSKFSGGSILKLLYYENVL